ncbi:MAG: nucleotide sugar dehydrogenase [Bacteroidetes bacterium]|nr:nucleotide sugar dehydrogenase [Bacteroidota bacterium]
MTSEKVIVIIGLGYVGLPLAVEFGKKYKTIGFDINEARIRELKSGNDKTLEISKEELVEAKSLSFTSLLEEISTANIFIVTVPTPVDKHNNPDLTPLRKASESVGSVLKEGDIVIYESTVYPGVTEEYCVPILQEKSKLEFNREFFVGYSPERINPGDKLHRLTTIRKITSGSTLESAQRIDQLYSSIISAGTYMAPSIKVAEAAKVIENAQRDINIAFINELSKIFNRLGIDTHEVLDAASTKWNFLPFRPGLVGGHCIGIDPYYLAQKAKELGYHPEIILAGRRLNDSMGAFVAQEFVKLLIHKSQQVKNTTVCILGITFKENCPDIRNSRVIDIVTELKSFGINVVVFDPWANPSEVKEEYNLLLADNFLDNADGYIIAVGHDEFKKIDFERIYRSGKVIYDVKGLLPKKITDGRL